MTIFFVADHHIDHANIIKYCNRPFTNVDEMETELITRHNEVVGPSDTVYFLGDFMMGNKRHVAAMLFGRLNGHIYLVPGDHDKDWIEGTYYSAGGEQVIFLPKLFTFKSPIEYVGDRSPLVTLCHWPMRSWPQSHYGALHVHGHTHNTIPQVELSDDRSLPPGQMRGIRFCASVEMIDYTPIRLEDIINQIRRKSL